jgi:FkbM family methyltransferase
MISGNRNYLPKVFSEEGQDILLFSILYKYVSTSSNNFAFLDIGANDPIINSNSYLLEKSLGITTIAIEPQIIYQNMWKKNRPKSIFINKALGDRDSKINLLVPKNAPNSFSSVEGGFNKKNDEYDEIVVEMTTINNILQSNNQFTIIGASIDVEGFEISVLKGINFEVNRIPLIIIENNSKQLLGSDNIRNLLINNNYIYIARLGYYDDLFISKEFFNILKPSLSFLGLK